MNENQPSNILDAEAHLNTVPAIDHDKSIDIYGKDSRGKSKFPCTWKLHALEHYIDTDMPLSMEMLDQIAEQLKEANLNTGRITVSDQYPKEDRPHYQITANFGDSDNLQGEASFSIKYSSIDVDSGETINGTITITANLPDNYKDIADFLTGIFITYDSGLNKYYPTLVTEYDEDYQVA